MKQIRPLIIFSGTACSKPQLQWRNEVGIQHHKKRQTSSHCASAGGVRARCCRTPIGNIISDRAPCCFWKTDRHYKGNLCVAETLAWVNVFLLAWMRRSVNTEHLQTQWSNKNNFVSPGNDAFPDLDNTKLSVDDGQPGTETFGIIFLTCTASDNYIYLLQIKPLGEQWASMSPNCSLFGTWLGFSGL